MLISCNQRQPYIEYQYYNSGKLKNKLVFKINTQVSDSCFTKFQYDTLGNLRSKIIYEKCQKTEYSEFYKNGHLKKIQPYKNGKKFGIEKLYTKEGELAESNFYINNSHMVQMKSFNNDGGTAEFYYYIESDTTEEMGLLLYSKDNQLIENKCFYYTAECKDTLNLNDSQELEITTFTENIENKIDDIYFGEFDEYYKFIDTSNVVHLTSETNKLTYTFKPKQLGYNTIMGKAYISSTLNSDKGSETFTREFIIYKDFYVNE